MIQRIYYLDNLRALAVLVLIPYHSARIFDWPSYYIQLDKITGFELFTRMVDVWIMPLFFLIAGASTVYSLGKRSNFKFVLERVYRLMVPFIIGMLTVIPINGYYAYLFHSGENLNFIEYLPVFFKVESLDGYNGTFTVSHLWFLVYLMLFSLVAPIFTKLLQFLKTLHEKVQPQLKLVPGLIVILMFLIIARMTSLPYPNPLYFIVFYFAGLIVFGIPEFIENLLKYGKYFLIAGLISMPVYMYVRMSPGLVETGEFGYETLQSLNALTWTFAFIYCGHAFIQNEYGVLKWINKHGLWIYIIHATVISMIAFYLIPYLKIPFLFWMITMLLSYMITLPLSVLAVRTGDSFKK